jgi:hypothetical protein
MTAPNPCPVCGAPQLWQMRGCDAAGRPCQPVRYCYQCAHVKQRLAYATPEKAAQAWNECVGRTNND